MEPSFLLLQEHHGVPPLNMWNMALWAAARHRDSTTTMWWGHAVKSAVSRAMRPRAQRWCAWPANTGPPTTPARVSANTHQTIHTRGAPSATPMQKWYWNKQMMWCVNVQRSAAPSWTCPLTADTSVPTAPTSTPAASSSAPLDSAWRARKPQLASLTKCGAPECPPVLVSQVSQSLKAS